MDVLCQQEKLSNCLVELALLIDTYWFDTPENIGHEPLNFNWRKYCDLEQMGTCVVFTAREPQLGKMVGAAIYMVVEHLHHAGYVIADCDTLCTSRAHRGQGIAAKLFKFVEPKLKELGAREILNRARLVYNTDHLFPSLGFTAIEKVYSKKLGD